MCSSDSEFDVVGISEPLSIDTESAFFPVPAGQRQSQQRITMSGLVMGSMPQGFFPSHRPSVLSLNPTQLTLPEQPGNQQELMDIKEERIDDAMSSAAARTTQRSERRIGIIPRSRVKAKRKGYTRSSPVQTRSKKKYPPLPPSPPPSPTPDHTHDGNTNHARRPTPEGSFTPETDFGGDGGI